MADDVKALSGVGGLVPEAFVDLLRRVTPGLLTFISFQLVTPPTFRIHLKSLSVASALVLLLVAYSIGLVLDALTAAGTDWFFIWITWCPLDNDELNRILKFLDKDKDERKPRGFLNGFFRYGSWRIPGLLRTRIRQLDTDAKMIVPKLVAEEFLLRNTAPGLLLVYLAGMLRIKTQWAPMAIVLNNNQDIFTLLGLFAVPLLIASYHRARRTLRRTIELVQFLQMGPAGSQRTDQPEALGLSKAART